jgi:anti-sigma factor (TIGR02949 family)
LTGDSDKKIVEDHDCLDAIRNLYAYLDGELDEAARAKLEHHLGHCRSCYTRAGFEAALNEQLQKHGKKQAPESLQNRLRGLIDNF